ncbi:MULTISPECIES: hypothetical protein [Microbacterium]|uniref:EVE domain-containing protein n=1 Tax=Microbacterium wangchenii TaxID=2541726 RepID=A0ABX5SQZ5_9MICO|nr:MULTISPECIES: hypothetical protein [Microbacterium]MCK6065111.1 hypothetical protein [Microbacterium sp. EYE_512]QBR88568.1 hypothetical protein E4K62_07650 [Microbacterium wangchenii]TXK20294.1 hypothetical protein FVP99_01265 [Microbacterium wangchenii]
MTGTSRSGADYWRGAGVILGWNPSLWDEWPGSYAAVVARVAEGAPFVTQWSVGARKEVEPGTDAWLLRQGGSYGLIGHGTVRTHPYQDVHFADPRRTASFVDVAFDELVIEADRVPRDVLEVVVPEVAWRFQFRSGNRIPPGPNQRLREVWADSARAPDEPRG